MTINLISQAEDLLAVTEDFEASNTNFKNLGFSSLDDLKSTITNAVSSSANPGLGQSYSLALTFEQANVDYNQLYDDFEAMGAQMESDAAAIEAMASRFEISSATFETIHDDKLDELEAELDPRLNIEVARAVTLEEVNNGIAWVISSDDFKKLSDDTRTMLLDMLESSDGVNDAIDLETIIDLTQQFEASTEGYLNAHLTTIDPVDTRVDSDLTTFLPEAQSLENVNDQFHTIFNDLAALSDAMEAGLEDLRAMASRFEVSNATFETIHDDRLNEQEAELDPRLNVEVARAVTLEEVNNGIAWGIASDDFKKLFDDTRSVVQDLWSDLNTMRGLASEFETSNTNLINEHTSFLNTLETSLNTNFATTGLRGVDDPARRTPTAQSPLKDTELEEAHQDYATLFTNMKSMADAMQTGLLNLKNSALTFETSNSGLAAVHNEYLNAADANSVGNKIDSTLAGLDAEANLLEAVNNGVAYGTASDDFKKLFDDTRSMALDMSADLQPMISNSQAFETSSTNLINEHTQVLNTIGNEIASKLANTGLRGADNPARITPTAQSPLKATEL